MKNKTKAEVKRIAFEVTNLIKIITDDYKMKQTEDEIEITCCGDEITGIVKDIGLCPTCLEHI
jgi:hypothetical protein